jgi:hypothetical protein
MRMCFGRPLSYCAACSGSVGTVAGNCAPSSSDRLKMSGGPRGISNRLRYGTGSPAAHGYEHYTAIFPHFELLRLSSSSIVELTSRARRLANREFHPGTAGLDINLLPPGRARAVFRQGEPDTKS